MIRIHQALLKTQACLGVFKEALLKVKAKRICHQEDEIIKLVVQEVTSQSIMNPNCRACKRIIKGYTSLLCHLLQLNRIVREKEKETIHLLVKLQTHLSAVQKRSQRDATTALLIQTLTQLQVNNRPKIHNSTKATKDQGEITRSQVKTKELPPTTLTDSFQGKLKQELPKWMERTHKR